MRLFSTFLSILLVTLLLSASGGESSAPEATAEIPSSSNLSSVDLDLTQLSSTMVYSEVYNIMMSPKDYVGKVIRMEGQCLSAYYEPTDATYYSIVIQDATACCAQGIEYVLAGNAAYPPDDSNATVVGRFASYEEEGTTWYHLVDAVLESA